MTTSTDIMTDDFKRFLRSPVCNDEDLWKLTPEQMEFVAKLDERNPEVRDVLYGKA